MAWNRLKDYTVFRSPMVRACLAVWLLLAIALVSMAPRVKRRYERWSASRFAQRAAEFCEKKDYDHALLDARNALELNRQNMLAIQVIAQSLEAVGSRDAIEWRRQFDQLDPGNVENTMAWAKDAFQAGDFDVAERLLTTLKPQDRGSASYHDIAARVAMGKSDLRAAETHWAEAARLDPNESQYHLNAATLRLKARTPQIRADAIEAINGLAGNPDVRLQSLRTLLADAIEHVETARATELADTLAADPLATFADQLTRLSTLRKIDDPRSASLLPQLRDSVVSKPKELFQLLGWMNRRGLALLVSEWGRTLPAEMTSKPPVCVALAEAYDRSMEWGKIEALARGDSWGSLDFLRSAYLARVLARSDDPVGSTAAWNAAVILARKSPESSEALAKMALDWGWKAKAHEVLWGLSSHDRCPRWVLDALWATSFKRGETAELLRLSKQLAKADPKNLAHRNNVIFLGLLLRTKEGTAHDMAAVLYRENPGDPNVIATYGLSCFQRGLAKEAVALIETVNPEQLHEPGTARYYGIFLAGAKKPDQARIWLELGAKGDMLPEEKALVLGARVSSSSESAAYLAQLNHFATSKPEELDERVLWMNAHDLAPLVSSWAASLDAEVAARPKISMAIAEAHGRALEWSRLKELTAAASWGELDYMRRAYRARALDRLNDTAGSELEWKASIEAAHDAPEALESLAKVLKVWGWVQKGEEILWKLSSQPDCPRWVIDSLWEIAMQQGDSGQVRKASKLLASDAKGLRTRNNAVVLALLTRNNEGTMWELAESLFTESPTDAGIASIRALSLHQQGRAEDALAMMRAFTPAQLSESRGALYYGILLAAAGQGEQAKDYLDIAATRVLSVEEKALITRAKIVGKSPPRPAPSPAPEDPK